VTYKLTTQVRVSSIQGHVHHLQSYRHPIPPDSKHLLFRYSDAMVISSPCMTC
jgi:hypothetical protein